MTSCCGGYWTWPSDMKPAKMAAMVVRVWFRHFPCSPHQTLGSNCFPLLSYHWKGLIFSWWWSTCIDNSCNAAKEGKYRKRQKSWHCLPCSNGKDTQTPAVSEVLHVSAGIVDDKQLPHTIYWLNCRSIGVTLSKTRYFNPYFWEDILVWTLKSDSEQEVVQKQEGHGTVHIWLPHPYWSSKQEATPQEAVTKSLLALYF